MLLNISVRNSYQTPAVKSPASKHDLTVFIDVFRASTTLLTLLKHGAGEVVGIYDPALIRDYMSRGYLLVSEVIDEGLDNSPSQVADHGVNGEKVVMKTGNLITAVFNNLDFERAVVAGFANLDAVSGYILRSGYRTVDIVAASHFEERYPALEDVTCAQVLVDRLLDIPVDHAPLVREIREIYGRKMRAGTSRMPEHYWIDIQYALQMNTIPLIPGILKLDNGVVAFRCKTA